MRHHLESVIPSGTGFHFSQTDSASVYKEIDIMDKAWKEWPKVVLYSDGGADPNPGKGGYGIILSYKGKQKEFSQGYMKTTNNRMELMGVIEGLKKLKTSSEVTVYTDSRYVVDGINKGWARKWQANNWYRNSTEKAINVDLWEKLLGLLSIHKVIFNWIRGHHGHPENERCDKLAELAAKQKNLLKDNGYYDQNNLIQGQLEKQLKTYENNGYAKSKILKAGDKCRKCNTQVIKKIPKHKTLKEGQTYYFEYYLFCPKCKTNYMVEEAKRFIDK